MVLKAVLARSNFTTNSIDLTKEWSEQSLPSDNTFWAFVDAKDYGCGLSISATRGVFGSLAKKNMVNLIEDECDTWIAIKEKEFNNIRNAML